MDQPKRLLLLGRAGRRARPAEARRGRGLLDRLELGQTFDEAEAVLTRLAEIRVEAGRSHLPFEAVIPLIPEAELCYTCRAIGLEDANWLLPMATPAQVVACFDLVEEKFPGLRELVIDPATGEIHKFVKVTLNGELLERDTGTLAQSVSATDEIEVIAAIAGG